MEANQLPTKPGPYYWRESDGDEFQLVTVELHIYNRNPDVVHLSCYSGKEMRMLPIKDLQGQWLPIPTAEELVKLQAKAKAYDKGREQWQIWDPCHSKLEMVGRTENEAITAFRKSIPSSNPPEPWSQYLAAGYTCRKVRVCKEVDE
jgi:hypothetical protein